MDCKHVCIVSVTALLLLPFFVNDAPASQDWKVDANARIEQLRKADFRIAVVDPDDPTRRIADIPVKLDQLRHHFAFGSAINYNVANPDYAAFFKDTFEWAVMENESKWYANQPDENEVTYAVADRIVRFCADNDITLRGHCIFWAKEKYVQDWLRALDKQQLEKAVVDRLNSVVNHFKGVFVHWDVNNEMCDGTYFMDHLGAGIRPWMFRAARAVDPDVSLFVNDYHVIAKDRNLEEYRQQIAELLKIGTPIDAVGVQCHMETGFDPQVVKNRLDGIAEMNLPVWVTEFDVNSPTDTLRADELENFYRLAFSHPAVQGILMWGFWENSHWRQNCHIVDADWTLNAAGRRYRDLMAEWTTHDTAATDGNGCADFRGFYGAYRVTLAPKDGEPVIKTIRLTPDGPRLFTLSL